MTDPLPPIDFEHFSKIDLRVATVRACEPHPNADKLLKVTLDDGTPEGRQVCAGIKAWYEPESLVGKQVVIVANLEPRKLRVLLRRHAKAHHLAADIRKSET